MSKEQNDDFLSDDELMEEMPMEEDFQAGEEFAEGEMPESMEGGEFEADPMSDEAMPLEGPEEDEKPIMYRPPRMDLYTVLLTLSLIFVLVAAAIHYFECPSSEYGTVPFKKNSPKVSAPN